MDGGSANVAGEEDTLLDPRSRHRQSPAFRGPRRRLAASARGPDLEVREEHSVVGSRA